MSNKHEQDCDRCGHVYLPNENIFQHDYKNPKEHTALDDIGFSRNFQDKMAWLFREATRNLLTSEGWRVFDADIDITHDEIEKRVDMQRLANDFESWLDDRLNEINRDTPAVKPVGQDFHKPEDCPRRVLVKGADAEFPNEYHHGECDMPKCVCTHYNDDRDHWGGCPYSGQRIPRNQVQSHAVLTGVM